MKTEERRRGNRIASSQQYFSYAFEWSGCSYSFVVESEWREKARVGRPGWAEEEKEDRREELRSKEEETTRRRKLSGHRRARISREHITIQMELTNATRRCFPMGE